MKPHEETWRAYQSGKANYGISRQNPRRTVATRIKTHEEAALLTAAPEMARALLAMGEVYEVRPTLEEWHLDDCIRHRPQHGCTPECETAQAALKKAGVLP